MSRISGFERDALMAIFGKTNWAGDVEAGISGLEVTERSDTGVGFYTTIQHRDSRFRLIDANARQPPTIVVRHKKLVHDGIVTLWVTDDGFIEGMEGVSFASELWPADDLFEFVCEKQR